jgi:hypothetical protein
MRAAYIFSRRTWCWAWKHRRSNDGRTPSPSRNEDDKWKTKKKVKIVHFLELPPSLDAPIESIPSPPLPAPLANLFPSIFTGTSCSCIFAGEKGWSEVKIQGKEEK